MYLIPDRSAVCLWTYKNHALWQKVVAIIVQKITREQNIIAIIVKIIMLYSEQAPLCFCKISQSSD
jgi:hypothetical protein